MGPFLTQPSLLQTGTFLNWVRQPAYCMEGPAGAPEASLSWHVCNCSSLEILVPDMLPEMSDCTNSLCVYNNCFVTRHGRVFPSEMKTKHERNQCASAFNTVPERTPTVLCLRSQLSPSCVKWSQALGLGHCICISDIQAKQRGHLIFT